MGRDATIALYLPYICPTSPLYLPYTSSISPLHLPYICQGYRELWDAMRGYGGAHPLPELHTYGSGPEGEEIAAAAHALPTVQVNGGIDHAHPSLHGYRVFVNPSTSDVLCTATAEVTLTLTLTLTLTVLCPATAEALAMGRVRVSHP